MAYKEPHWDFVPARRARLVGRIATTTNAPSLELPAGRTLSIGPTMFTTFLVATAATVSAVMGGMLLRPRPDVAPVHVPYRALGVGSAAAALVALGLWMI